MSGLNMSREEMRAALRAERLTATRKLMTLKATAREVAGEIQKLEDRLADIDHAEGYLGPS